MRYERWWHLSSLLMPYGEGASGWEHRVDFAALEWFLLHLCNGALRPLYHRRGAVAEA